MNNAYKPAGPHGGTPPAVGFIPQQNNSTINSQLLSKSDRYMFLWDNIKNRKLEICIGRVEYLINQYPLTILSWSVVH